MGGPDLGRHEYLVASNLRGAQTFSDLALVLIDLRGVDVAIPEAKRLLDQTRQARPRSSQVPNPIAGILAPLASTNCMLEVPEQIEPIMSRRRGAANNAARRQTRAKAANTVSGA
jgi:hypothetical protein